MDRNPYEPPQTSGVETPNATSPPSAAARRQALLMGLALGATFFTVGVFLLAVANIGVAMLRQPDLWDPGGGVNFGAIFLLQAAILNLPTAAAWIGWWIVTSRSRLPRRREI